MVGYESSRERNIGRISKMENDKTEVDRDLDYDKKNKELSLREYEANTKHCEASAKH